ncbi:hypothetical protein OS493_011160 [Desmophyllum pertusum]|uniref:Uncharacterized protein n=1 Tax=Desmophyllum pertusum TaxID=174260 RepID=A0A9X0CRP4_9CNID|nr:hypothetical protein OS493_011160 [Desmophyllum pertusum]
MFVCCSQESKREKNQLCARFGAKNHHVQQPLQDGRDYGQETEPVQPSPTLRPRTPVQPYPYFPWQPKGDCLSSTKARLYEAKPVNEKELKKSLSQISLEEKKTKKVSQKEFLQEKSSVRRGH